VVTAANQRRTRPECASCNPPRGLLQGRVHSWKRLTPERRAVRRQIERFIAESNDIPSLDHAYGSEQIAQPNSSCSFRTKSNI
jgi:hypothetical protein